MLLSTYIYEYRDSQNSNYPNLDCWFKVSFNASTIFQSRLLVGYFHVPSSSFFWMHEPSGLQRLVKPHEESFFDLVEANEVSPLFNLTFVYKW